VVEDDGPGVPDTALESALTREGPTQDGAGLTIVSDLVEACGGTLTLDPSRFGGLRAAVRLPSRH